MPDTKQVTVHSAYKSLREELALCLAASIPVLYQHVVDLGGVMRGDMRQYSDHAFIDRGSDILAVAHADSVASGVNKMPNEVMDEVIRWDTVTRKDVKERRWILEHPCLDDRLGVFTILHLLPALGVNVDVLISNYEERGRTSAKHFTPPEGKQYKWMVQFDRTGEDVVLYQYERDNENGDAWKKAVAADFLRIGTGSYSCIRSMEHLGICGMNVGIGYHNYHSADAFAILTQYKANVFRFLKFHQNNSEIAYPWKRKVWSARSTQSGYNYPARTGLSKRERKQQKKEAIKASIWSRVEFGLDRCHLCGDLLAPATTVNLSITGGFSNAPRGYRACALCADDMVSIFRADKKRKESDLLTYAYRGTNTGYKWVGINHSAVVAMVDGYMERLQRLYRFELEQDVAALDSTVGDTDRTKVQVLIGGEEES